MRGKARLFSPLQGFTYWFPERSRIALSSVQSDLGKTIILRKRATCRMCGKRMQPGEQAIIDASDFDDIGHVDGFIHAAKCIPLVELVMGNQTEQGFEERERIRSDGYYHEEAMKSYSLEYAQQDEARYFLDSYWSGIFQVCYVEVDGIRHPEPIYSEWYKKTEVART